MNLCVCRYCVIYIYWIYWFIHLQYVLPWFLCVPAVWMRGLIHPETKHITTHSCSLYTWMGCLVSVWNDLFVVWKHGFNIVQQIWKEYVQSCWSKSNTIPWFPHDFMASDHTHTHTLPSNVQAKTSWKMERVGIHIFLIASLFDFWVQN